MGKSSGLVLKNISGNKFFIKFNQIKKAESCSKTRVGRWYFHSL